MMESIGQFLGVAGFLGTILIFIIGSLVFAVIPIWAIIDCLMRDDEDMHKLVGAGVIFITWSFGGFVYAIFITKTSVLRIVSIISIILLGFGFFLSAGACLTGAAIHGKTSHDKRKKLITRYHPTIVSADSFGTFEALHVDWSGRPRRLFISSFDLNGAKGVESTPTKIILRHITKDVNNQYYGLSIRDLMTVDGENCSKIEPPQIRFFWPRGLVYDENNMRLILGTGSGSGTSLYSYYPAEKRWECIKKRGVSELDALALDNEQSLLYGIKVDDMAIKRLNKLSMSGSLLAEIDLKTEIPVVSRKYHLQALWTNGRVIVIVGRSPTYSTNNFKTLIVAINPDNGDVAAVSAEVEKDD